MRIRPGALPKMVSCSSMLGITIYSTFHWLVDPDEADFCVLESGRPSELPVAAGPSNMEWNVDRGVPSTVDRR